MSAWKRIAVCTQQALPPAAAAARSRSKVQLKLQRGALASTQPLLLIFIAHQVVCCIMLHHIPLRQKLGNGRGRKLPEHIPLAHLQP